MSQDKKSLIISLGLQGRLKVAEQVPSLETLKTKYPDVSVGGEMSPGKCLSLANVAIVVPYRNRQGQLRMFLNHMHRLLQKQKIHYRIYIINQVEPFI